MAPMRQPTMTSFKRCRYDLKSGKLQQKGDEMVGYKLGRQTLKTVLSCEYLTTFRNELDTQNTNPASFAKIAKNLEPFYLLPDSNCFGIG